MLALFASLLFAVPKHPEVLSSFLVERAEAASIEISISTIQAYASSTAASYGLDVSHFLRTIACESDWNPSAVGDAGTSIGIAQLHYPSRDWGISTSTALNPFAAIDIMAGAWSRHLESRWSCYNLLYGSPL